MYLLEIHYDEDLAMYFTKKNVCSNFAKNSKFLEKLVIIILKVHKYESIFFSDCAGQNRLLTLGKIAAIL